MLPICVPIFRFDSCLLGSCSNYCEIVYGCEDLIDENSITMDQLVAWNTWLAGDCDAALFANLDKFATRVFCIGVDNSISTSQSNTVTVTTTQSATPAAPTQTGVASGCQKFHIVPSGDTCPSIESEYGITATQFYQWNPSSESTLSRFSSTTSVVSMADASFQSAALAPISGWDMRTVCKARHRQSLVQLPRRRLGLHQTALSTIPLSAGTRVPSSKGGMASHLPSCISGILPLVLVANICKLGPLCAWASHSEGDRRERLCKRIAICSVRLESRPRAKLKESLCGKGITRWRLF